MKKIFVFVSYVFLTLIQNHLAFGQSTLNDLFDRRLTSNDIWVKNDRVQGHPFLFEEWTSASISTIKGNYSDVSIKLNLEKNEVYYKDEADNVLILMDDYVTGVDILDPKDRQVRKFIKIPLKGYYEVIFDGETSLLLKHTKLFVPSISAEGVNAITTKSMDRYNLKSIVTLRIKNQLHSFENKKDLKNFFSNDSKTSSFISSNKIKVSNIDSMKNLVEYLNSANN
jgi:hypothetical protein